MTKATGPKVPTETAEPKAAARKPDPWPETFGYHEIFHLLVIVAAILHYCAIAFLVLPLQ